MVATVQGIEVTRGDIRPDAEFRILTSRASTRDTAANKSIVTVIDEFIEPGEIERRELTPTRDEAEDYMRRFRGLCMRSTVRNVAKLSRTLDSTPIAMNTRRTSRSPNMGRHRAKSNSSGP